MGGEGTVGYNAQSLDWSQGARFCKQAVFWGWGDALRLSSLSAKQRFYQPLGRQRGVEGGTGPGSEGSGRTSHSDASELCVTVAKSHSAFLGLSFLKWKTFVQLKCVLQLTSLAQLLARGHCHLHYCEMVNRMGETVDCLRPLQRQPASESQEPAHWGLVLIPLTQPQVLWGRNKT